MTILNARSLTRAIVRGSIVRSLDGGGWTPPTDTYPTAFSPTVRGGAITNAAPAGVYTTATMRTVVNSLGNTWKGIRTMSGITAGQKISCTCLIEGSTEEQGMGVINSSGTVEESAGSNANGFNLFFHIDQVYHNGAPVASLTSVTIGDRVRMDIDFDAATMQFYKQAGGSGAFVSMGAAIDISALGAGPWYPVANLYNANGQQTWDFGQTAFAVESGFTRGPRGNWGWWNDPAIVAAMTETWLASDTTRMWELAASVGAGNPDVVNNDPLGGWYGILYARLLEQGTAGQRPTYTTAGVRFNATGGTKQMADALASTFNANTPFTVLLNFDLLSGRSIRAGLGTSATSLVSGVSWATGGKEVVTTRTSATALATTDVRNDACIVLTYDGTKAYALDSDGTWSEVLVGASTVTITHLILRATAAEATDATVYAYQILSGAVNESQAKNLQWSARNVL